MTRPARSKNVSSPYVRYGKKSYAYKFKSCSHRTDGGRPNTVEQFVASWRGQVCAVCNVILRNYAER